MYESGKDIRVMLLGDENAGKTTLLAALARYLDMTEIPNDVYYEDVADPRRRHIGGEQSPYADSAWIGGAGVRCVILPLRSPSHALIMIDAAGEDQVPYLLASPVTPDAVIFVVDGRTGLGRAGIRQIRIAAELGISQVILFINQFGMDASGGRLRAVRAETEALIEEHTGLAPVVTVVGSYKAAVRDLEQNPSGPYSNCLSRIAEAMYTLSPRTVEDTLRSGYDIPCVLLNLEGGFSVAPLPDRSRVKIKLPGTKGEIGARVRFLHGPEWKETEDDRILRSGSCSEAVIRCDEAVCWKGGERFSLFLNDTLRATGIAAVRSVFEPFAGADL